MNIALLTLSLVLVAHAVLAVGADSIAAAGIWVAGAAIAAGTLWRTRRGRLTPLDVELRGKVLVAIVVPDQIGRLRDLLAEADSASREVLVVAIEATPIPLASPRPCDPRLVLELERAVNSCGRPVSLMMVLGADPAFVVLDLARRLLASRVVVLRADATPGEQRSRCAAVWERLPLPRPSVCVRMIGSDGEEPIVLELPGAHEHAS